ncbi:DUF1579 family protein [Pontibacter sp. SGAir0037]|uniref:DUF1579 family protein n=1 Tax=Pontibacter sp. SGAir0037 TaxID=2571030 RepID=UPI0010CCC5F0|nr:DUF1579 family protein [Pontibacter sp. SGAir0037]QCR24699.1 hypothetical protein C1N53_21660 [Pontibacter sp. SGAir0037]
MKKTILFLLAAVLLVWAAPLAQAQSRKSLSADEANQLLQKITGAWNVELSTWSPKHRLMLKTKGDAKFNTPYLGSYVHEQFSYGMPDGNTLEGECFISYSTKQKRFEIAQVDNAGKNIILMTGEWFPEYRSIVFKPVEGLNHQAYHTEPGMQFRYIFLEDGSFSKMIHKRNADGAYTLASLYHYESATAAKK